MGRVVRRRRAVVPYVILAGGLLVTVLAGLYAWRAGRAQDLLRFETVADDVRQSIDRRLDAYVAMLRGGAGLFAASEHVSPDEFRVYVERLEVEQRYPGIQGIGITRVIPPDRRDAILAELHTAGLKDFRFWPDDSRPEVHAIVYLEPLDSRNRLALGYDMYSEPVRREAMARARDTGTAAASGRVRLVQEKADPGREQPGFLIYVPVYTGPSIPVTVEERRASLFGFVYSPFRAHDLLDALRAPAFRDVLYRVYDGSPEEAHLLYASPGATSGEGRFETVRTLDVGGRLWTIVFRPAPAFGPPSYQPVVLLVVLSGCALAVLLFLVTRGEVRAREAAERTAEELRRSAEALREANRSKDEFLAVISHELRTPLNTIVGWTAMLRKGVVPPDRQPHALEVIQRNATLQTMLIQDLLDVSRAVAGRLRLDVSDVELEPLLRAAVAELEPVAMAAGVVLEVNVPERLGTIRADPSRLQQVFGNLLSNALKFTPAGGRIGLSSAVDARGIRVDVRDTGQGIPREFLPFVFDAFRQADSSTTREHGGVGLGLAIARYIIELHGGTIDAHSSGEGQGATFTVWLPAQGRLVPDAQTRTVPSAV